MNYLDAVQEYESILSSYYLRKKNGDMQQRKEMLILPTKLQTLGVLGMT